MKTRLLIIIGIIGISVFFSATYFSSVFHSEETMVVGYCQDWCNADELTNLGCNAEVIDFIYRATNLFDEDYDNHYFSLDWIGLPDSISQEKFDECLDIIREKRVESLNIDLVSGLGLLQEDVDPEFTEQQFQAILEYCIDTKELVETRGLSYSNGTHTIDTMTCEWKLISEKTITGSYDLENPLCMGGRGIIVNESCERIGKYDPATGLPIVENKEQCDMLDGDWDEKQNICDSKYDGGIRK